MTELTKEQLEEFSLMSGDLSAMLQAVYKKGRLDREEELAPFRRELTLEFNDVTVQADLYADNLSFSYLDRFLTRSQETISELTAEVESLKRQLQPVSKA